MLCGILGPIKVSILPCFGISVVAARSCIACIWLPETLHFQNDDKVEANDELEAQFGDFNLEAGKGGVGAVENVQQYGLQSTRRQSFFHNRNPCRKPKMKRWWKRSSTTWWLVWLLCEQRC